MKCNNMCHSVSKNKHLIIVRCLKGVLCSPPLTQHKLKIPTWQTDSSKVTSHLTTRGNVAGQEEGSPD